jgi:hypothetical protein
MSASTEIRSFLHQGHLVDSSYLAQQHISSPAYWLAQVIQYFSSLLYDMGVVKDNSTLAQSGVFQPRELQAEEEAGDSPRR